MKNSLNILKVEKYLREIFIFQCLSEGITQHSRTAVSAVLIIDKSLNLGIINIKQKEKK